MQKQHISYSNQLSDLKIKDGSQIAEEAKTVTLELSELDKQLANLHAKERELKDLGDDARRIRDCISEVTDDVNSIIEGFGDEIAITQKQRLLDDQESQLKKDLDRVGVYNNLLNLAITYIEDTKQDVCPVCERPTEYEMILSSIRKRISEELVKRMEDLRQRLQRIRDDKDKSVQALKELKRLKKALNEFDAKLGDAKKRFYVISGIELKEPILESVDDQISALEKEIDEKEGKTEQYKTLLNDLKRAMAIIENLGSVEKKITDALGISGSSNELLNVLAEHIQAKNEESEKLQLIDETLSSVDEKINLLEDIATFLRRRQSLDTLEKSLAEIDKKLATQHGKLQKLQGLVEALTDIRDSANSVKMEELEDILSSIGGDINAMYSKLLGHPFFISLELVPEEERDIHIYRIVAYGKDKRYSTYVRTRFSQTQRNLVAIALFLAMAKRASAGLVILDDPSQSLDLGHKKAFVEVLQALMQEMQVIVATADETLVEQLIRSVQREELSAYRLHRWGEEGPVIEGIR